MTGTVKMSHLALLAWLACGLPDAAAAANPQQPGLAPAPTGQAPSRETERGPSHSLIEISLAGQGFGNMLSLVKAVYDIAKERMFEADGRARASDPLADLIGVFSLMAEGDPAFRVSKTGPDYFVESRGPDGWAKPVRLVAMTDAERAKAAKSGINVSAALRMTQGSADQQFDFLRVEEPLPGSTRTVVLHVLYTWFGPNLLYKLP